MFNTQGAQPVSFSLLLTIAASQGFLLQGSFQGFLVEVAVRGAEEVLVSFIAFALEVRELHLMRSSKRGYISPSVR